MGKLFKITDRVTRRTDPSGPVPSLIQEIRTVTLVSSVPGVWYVDGKIAGQGKVFNYPGKVGTSKVVTLDMGESEENYTIKF